ncbi:MAG: hypothetical protein IKP07_06395 [Bacilli bacterium]|nr:hypothetical protein [Bacilli bacterium]
MSIKNIVQLNKYTFAEKGTPDKIYYYIEAAMFEKEIKKNSLKVVFEITKEKIEKLYDMHILLVNKRKETVYRSYSVFLKEIDEYNYAILNGRNEITHAEIMPKNTINFNTLDYASFKKLLATEEEFTNMIPELTAALKDYQEEIQDEKEVAETIDISNPNNYYHNVVGNAVITFEELVANEKEQDITEKLLNQAKKNFEVILNNDYDQKLALINLLAYNISKSKSYTLRPKDILKEADLKLDTNKEELSLQELRETLNSFIKDEDPSGNIISERIHYILESKPRLKTITKFVKVIFIDNDYQDKKRRVRAISEIMLKDLLINSLVEETYLPLPRNEVLLYHLKDEETVDFLCVISLDLLYDLLNTIKLNAIPENQKAMEMYKGINNVYLNKKISKELYITINVNIIAMMYLYYLRNINPKTLLFNKGEYIIDLAYYKGEYDIKIINKNTKKIFGKLIKLNEKANTDIKEALEKNEKLFVDYINNLIYINIRNSIYNQSLLIDIKDISHKGIKFILKRPTKENAFECNFPIETIISILISPNKPRSVSTKDEEVEEEDSKYIYNIPIPDYEYIVRKADTINKIMNNTPLNNKEYIEISKLYEKFKEAKDDNKKSEILLKLAELFKIEITDIKKDEVE